MKGFFSVNNVNYAVCWKCRNIYKISSKTQTRSYWCPECARRNKLKIEPKVKLTAKEQKKVIAGIVQMHLDVYFKSMEKEYEIKNKS